MMPAFQPLLYAVRTASSIRQAATSARTAVTPYARLRMRTGSMRWRMWRVSQARRLKSTARGARLEGVAREEHVERRAAPDGAAHVDRSLVRVDDRLRDRQAEPGTGNRLRGCRLRAEERVEELQLVGFGDATAGICDLEHGVALVRDGLDVHP